VETRFDALQSGLLLALMELVDCDRLPGPAEPTVVGAGFDNQRAQRSVSGLIATGSDDKTTQQYLLLGSPACVLALRNARTYCRQPCRLQLVQPVHCRLHMMWLQRICIAALDATVC
jgi:hypothetical protein